MRPILFSTDHFIVWTAPAFAGLAALVSFLYYHRNRDFLGYGPDDFWGLMLALAAGTVGGAVGVYFLLFGGGPAGNLSFIGRFHQIAGGSYFGAFWGAAAAAWLFCRGRGLDASRALDVLGGATPLGLSMMRVGCLLNGCCYGRPTRLPWGIVFTDPHSSVPRSLRGVPLHPTQLYEIAGSLAILAFVQGRLLPSIRDGRARPGTAFLASMALYGALRFFVDFLRATDVGVLTVGGVTTGQLLALGGLTFALAASRRKPA